jgi:hypothetical protein
MHLVNVVLLATVLGSNPQTRIDSALHDTLAGRYAALKSAMASKNEAAIRGLLADDFVSVDVSGKSEDTATMVKEVLAVPPDPDRHSETTIESLTRDGNTVVVQQHYHMTKEAAGPNGAKKAVDLSTHSTDTWIDEGGSWRIAKTVTNQLDYSVNGVIVAHEVSATK